MTTPQPMPLFSAGPASQIPSASLKSRARSTFKAPVLVRFRMLA